MERAGSERRPGPRSRRRAEAPRRPPPAQDSGRFGVRVCVRTDRPVLQYAKKKKKSNRRVSGRPGHSGAYGHGPDSSPPAGGTSRRRGRARPEARSKKPRNKRGGDWPGCRDSDGAPALGARGARGADFALGTRCGERVARTASAGRRRCSSQARDPCVPLPPCPGPLLLHSFAAPAKTRPAARRRLGSAGGAGGVGGTSLGKMGSAPGPAAAGWRLPGWPQTRACSSPLLLLSAGGSRLPVTAGRRLPGSLQTKACSSPASPRAD